MTCCRLSLLKRQTMIVDSMTDEEVFQELGRDRETLSHWWRHKLESLRRHALKCSRFPLCLDFEYMSPRRIHYIIHTRILDKRMRRIVTGCFALRRLDGLILYTAPMIHQVHITQMVFTAHMLRRYAERCGVELSGVELARHYVCHNSIFKDCYDQRLVGRSVRWNGEEHVSFCTPNGVVLGHDRNGIFIARTFITYDMTTGIQREEFGRLRDQIPTERELHDASLCGFWF